LIEKDIIMANWQGDKNSGKLITPAVFQQVCDLAKGNTPRRVIGGIIGRTEASVRGIASDNSVSLKPTNQPPNEGKR
jgi:hypothetical protein